MVAISIDDDDTSTDYEYLCLEDFVRDRVRHEYGFIETPDLRSARGCLEQEGGGTRRGWNKKGDRHRSEAEPVPAHDCRKMSRLTNGIYSGVQAED